MDSAVAACSDGFQQLTDVGCDLESRTEPPCFVASLEKYIHPVQLPSPGCQEQHTITALTFIHHFHSTMHSAAERWWGLWGSRCLRF